MSGANLDNLRLAIDEHQAQLERNAERSVLLGSFSRVVSLQAAALLHLFSRVVSLQAAALLHLETEVERLREARGPFEVLSAAAPQPADPMPPVFDGLAERSAYFNAVLQDVARDCAAMPADLTYHQVADEMDEAMEAGEDLNVEDRENYRILVHQAACAIRMAELSLAEARAEEIGRVREVMEPKS